MLPHLVQEAGAKTEKAAEKAAARAAKAAEVKEMPARSASTPRRGGTRSEAWRTTVGLWRWLCQHHQFAITAALGPWRWLCQHHQVAIRSLCVVIQRQA